MGYLSKRKVGASQNLYHPKITLDINLIFCYNKQKWEKNMKHMIKWLKVCAFLLMLVLIVHSMEITYDIIFHHRAGNILTPH